jgi:glucans biosynthesis protein C
MPVMENAERKGTGRLLFVDDIRVFLTILVLLHHLMIIYAGTGNWPYTEGMQDASKAMQGDVSEALGGWFCAVNQAYFMGLFLLISAYFVPGSYDRKGAGRFLKDRLIRLGIPLALFSWVINPVFVYVVYYRSIDKPFWRFFPAEYFRGGLIGQGPLWFIEVLLIFSLVYVLYRLLVRSRPANPPKESRFPTNRTIVLFAALLGLAGFLVRSVFVMDEYNFQPLNLQLPFFAQYVALFVLGLIAWRRNWLVELPDKTGRLWLRIAAIMILLWAPMMVVNGAINDDNSFKGGANWQSLAYAFWESFLCMSMCIGLVYLFRRCFKRQGKIAGFLAPNAYTAYLIHALVITALAFAFQDIALFPQLKWAMVALVAVPLCFGISALIRKLPYTDRVL